VVKRLFHFGVKKEEPEDVAPRPYADYPQVSSSTVDHKSGDTKKPAPAAAPARPAPPTQASRSKVDHKSGEPKKKQPVAARPQAPAAPRPAGFLAQQRDRKKLKASRRMENTKR
jgi:hypothetical protein